MRLKKKKSLQFVKILIYYYLSYLLIIQNINEFLIYLASFRYYPI